VEYEVSPPAFSDIYAEHQRLWALSAGETKAKEFRSTANAMRVYYTDATNNENAWYNATTQEVGYVNLLNKSRRFDELVRISSLEGNMVFFSRHNTFIYSGDDPSTLGEFVWVKTLPVGCANGNLVQKYPSDVLFFTLYGARSLRTVFTTEGQEVVPDLGSAIDPTITTYISDMMGSNAAFRAARSFFYERDGFYGYQMGGRYLLVYALNEESKGWVFFDGLPKDATAFLGTSDGRLLIGSGTQLYSYANGTDTEIGTAYGDNGVAILIKWFLPWMRTRRGRWSNIGYELVMEDVSETSMSIYRAVDELDDGLAHVADISTSTGSSYWDVSEWDDVQWDAARRRGIVRDKFLADSFALLVQNESTAGPISVIGIKPIGK
jgi:hypothetical protein